MQPNSAYACAEAKGLYPAEEGWVAVFRHDEGVYTTFVRDHLESGKFELGILNIATVDDPGMCLYASPYPYRVGRTICISAWALTLSVQFQRQFPEPQMVERTAIGSTLFLCLDASVLVT